MPADAVSTSAEPKTPSSDRESARAAFFALPVLANWLPGIILLAAILMPQVTGCDNRPVRPLDTLAKAADDPFQIFVLWQHWYGAFVIALFAVVLTTDRADSDRKLAGGVLGFWLLVVAIMLIGPLLGEGPGPSLEDYLTMMPFILLPTLWSLASLKRRDWISAWARTATSISLIGVLWTYMTYLFNRGARYGIFVTYGSLMLLAIAPWWLRVRWKQTLIASTEPATPIRFQIWHVLAAMTLFALVYGYYRYLVPAFDE